MASEYDALLASEYDALIPASDISGIRSQFATELIDDPEMVTQLYSLTKREVGSQGPAAQQAFMETVFNRAYARNKSLRETISDPNYFPKISLKPARLSEEDVASFNQILDEVKSGSNISKSATGNASGSVGFAGGPQTFEANGERFGIEGPDIGRTVGSPYDALIVGEKIRSGIESTSEKIAGEPTEAAVRESEAKQYEMILNPDEENVFKQWKDKFIPNDSGQDYDFRGAFKAGISPDPITGHWPDTFKKPNHPTFSVESIYAQAAPEKAGHWEGETFIPPQPPSEYDALFQEGTETSGSEYDALLAAAPEEEGFLAKVNRLAKTPSPEFLQNPEAAIRETVLETIPRTPYEYLTQIYPPLAAAEQGKQVVEGNLAALPGIGTIKSIQEAGETPAFSKERYKAEIRTLMDLGLFGAAGAKARPRTVAEAVRAEPVRPVERVSESPIVYHVTNKKFDQFDIGKSGSIGIHFGNAETAARIRSEMGENVRTIPAKLDIKNPIILDKDLVFQDPQSLANDLVKKGILDTSDIKVLEPEFNKIQKARETAAWDDDPKLMSAVTEGHKALTELLQDKGYDGIIYPNAFEGTGVSYAVFSPKQIKTAPGFTIGTDQEILAKAPWMLPKEKIEAAITGAEKTLADVKESATRGVKTKSIEDGLNQLIVEWKNILNETTKTKPNIISTISSGEQFLTETQKTAASSQAQTSEAPFGFGPGAASAGEPLASYKKRAFGERVVEDQRLAEDLRENIGNQYYEPIPNRITADEAAKLVNERPISDTIKAVMDEKTEIPFHVRSTMGQMVMLRLKEAQRTLVEAGDVVNAERLMDQSIRLAEWQMEYGTRLGQGVQSFAMWSKLSPEATVVKTMRDVHTVQDNFKTQHPELEQIKNGAIESAAEVKGEIPVTSRGEPIKSRAKLTEEEKINAMVERQQDKIAQHLSDTPTWKLAKQPKRNEILALIRAHLKTAQDNFVGRMQEFGVGEGLSKSIDRMALENRRRIEVISKAKDRLRRASEFDKVADRIADQLSDTPTFRERGQPDEARALIRRHLKSEQPEFVKQLTEFGADRKTAESIDRLSANNRERILAINRANRAEALRKQFTRSRVARKFKKADWEKFVEMADHNLLTDRAFMDVAGERLGLPRFTKENQTAVLRMAEKIDKAPEGMPKDRATFELARFITDKMGFKTSDLPSGIYYANMLSGYNTQLVNAIDTFLNVTSEVNGMAISNPKAAMKIYGNALKGLVEGRADALLALSEGRMMTNSKWLEVPRLLEVSRFGEKGGVPLKTTTRTGRTLKGLAEKKIAYPLNAWKYVARLMSASDSIMNRGAIEARAALLADRVARKEGLKGKALDRRVQEILGRTEEQIRAYADQAKAEGFEGASAVARISELREQGRGIEARADAREWAGIATYNHDPQGLLGHFSKSIDRAFEPIPLVRAVVVPFTRIVANVTNRGINYTPWGFRRAFSRYGKDAADPISSDARAAMVTRATLGTMGLSTLFALQQLGALEINGAGPSDIEKRRQLQESGWKPYSIKIGDQYWSYIYTPIGLGLSVLGNIQDSYRYGELEKRGAVLRGAYALSRIGSTIFSQSFLSGLSNFFGALSSGPGETVSRLRKIVQSTAGTATTPRILLDIKRLFDPKLYDSDTVGGDLLRNTPFASVVNRPTLNAFGEPVKIPSNRFISRMTNDPVWRLVVQSGVRVPVPDKSTKMPDGRGGTRQISPEEYYEYLSKSGPRIKSWIKMHESMFRENPERAEERLKAAARDIHEPILDRLRAHARHNPE